MQLSLIKKSIISSVFLFLIICERSLLAEDKEVPYSSFSTLEPLAAIDQQGVFDESFGNKGIVKLKFGEKNNKFNKILLLKDGTLLVAGTAPSSNNIVSLILTKFNSDGSLNLSFGKNGIVQTDIGRAVQFKSISITNDASIIVLGTSDYNLLGSSSVVLKYNADGSVNKSFGKNGLLEIDNKWIQAETHDVASDDSFILGGMSVQKNPTTQRDISTSTVVKYNSDGTQNLNFGDKGRTIVHTLYGSYTDKIIIKKDGIIVTAGRTWDSNHDITLNMTKLYSNGSLNRPFGRDGVVLENFGTRSFFSLKSMTLLNDGSILVSADAFAFNELKQIFNVIAFAKFNPNGTRASYFGSNGVMLTSILKFNFYLITLFKMMVLYLHVGIQVKSIIIPTLLF